MIGEGLSCLEPGGSSAHDQRLGLERFVLLPKSSEGDGTGGQPRSAGEMTKHAKVWLAEEPWPCETLLVEPRGEPLGSQGQWSKRIDARDASNRIDGKLAREDRARSGGHGALVAIATAAEGTSGPVESEAASEGGRTCPEARRREALGVLGGSGSRREAVRRSTSVRRIAATRGRAARQSSDIVSNCSTTAGNRARTDGRTGA